MGRFVQSKILNLSSRIIQLDLKRERDVDIDHKIIDKGYNFNFRIMIYCKNERYIKPIEDELNGVLRELDYYNQLRLVEVSRKEVGNYLSNYIQHEMSYIGEPQILSETELLSLFISNMDSKAETHVNTKKTNTQQSKVGVNYSGLELLPKSPITNREIDESIGEHIIQAIKDLKLNKNHKLNVVEQTRSATLQRVSLEIPKGIKFSDIEKSYKDIKAILGYETFTIEPGHIGGTVTFNIPSDEREIVYLRDMMETEQYKKAKNEYTLPLVIGLDMLGEPLIVDLAALPHLLIGGTTGGGKSYLLNSLILNLLLTKKPNELNMYLIDPKKVEFPIFDGFSNTKVVTSVDDSISLFDQICNEMDRRYDEFSKVKVRDIKGYNKKFPNRKLPYNVVVVDELADLMIISQKQVEDYIVRLGQLARASGIHIILATQRPDAEVVTGIIKANIASRIALSVSDYRNSQIIIDQRGAEKLLGKGDGLAKIIGQKRELIRFQSPVITLDDSELEDILDGLKDGVSMDENEDVMEENEEEPIEKMKRIIANTGVVTISDLQKEMGIRINVVSELRKQLIDEGWLVQDGRSYKIADEGEYRGE
jgi:S-DNA-T family DNA segregation ATPase FtsK/SpoIIIE